LATHERYLSALEEAIAEIIGQFEATPDLYLNEADLHAALYGALLRRRQLFGALCRTRDGRETGLVHRAYPSFFGYADGLGVRDEIVEATYDLVVLNASFVRNQPLEVVANREGQGARLLRELPFAQRPRPALAAVNLVLADDLLAHTMMTVVARFEDLVRAAYDAEYGYMVVLCRHWDLKGHLLQALPVMEGWAEDHPQLSIVAVQSYADPIGRLFTGRYLNTWKHMAPLPPLDAAPPPAISRALGRQPRP